MMVLKYMMPSLVNVYRFLVSFLEIWRINMKGIYEQYRMYIISLCKSLMEQTSIFDMVTTSAILIFMCSIFFTPVCVILLYTGYDFFQSLCPIFLLGTLVARVIVKRGKYNYNREQITFRSSHILAKGVFAIFYTIAIISYLLFAQGSKTNWQNYMIVILFCSLSCITAINSRLLKDKEYRNV
jgi:hypothetical protein